MLSAKLDMVATDLFFKWLEIHQIYWLYIDMKKYSPYLSFPRQKWHEFRKETPLTLTEADLEKLHGQIEEVSLDEVTEVYLPLSRLLNLYITATQQLYRVTAQFLDHPAARVPYIIGIAGSVAVGKSTTSRILQALLSRWPNHPRVSLITTDGFLYSNKILQQRGLMEKKGFPESYDISRLIQFLIDLKSGKSNLKIPLYSHYNYDIVAGKYETVSQPDIVIIEGINVLQVNAIPSQKNSVFVSDFFDFTIYVDAETKIIKEWFLERFKVFRAKAKTDPQDYFYYYAQMNLPQALSQAKKIWREINEKNLYENILPFRERAQLILVKGSDHSVKRVYLRKI